MESFKKGLNVYKDIREKSKKINLPKPTDIHIILLDFQAKMVHERNKRNQ